MLFALRVTAMVVYFLVVAGLGLLVGLMRPFNPDNSRVIARLFAWGGQRILGLRVNVEGLEQLKDLGPCVYVCNHQDNLDLFVLGGMLPKRTVSVGKKSLRWIPLFGLMYWLAGNVLIDRGNRQRALGAMTEVVTALRTRNTSIWIFPEGTRNRGQALLPFKKGAFHTAVQAGVPLVPVCVSSYASHADFHRLHSGEVFIRVLPPVSTAGLTLDDVPELMQQCFDQIKSGVETLDHLPLATPQMA